MLGKMDKLGLLTRREKVSMSVPCVSWQENNNADLTVNSNVVYGPANTSSCIQIFRKFPALLSCPSESKMQVA